MQRKSKKWLLLIPIVILVIGIIILFNYFNINYALYSGQWTYTTSDDMEQYLIRWPDYYIEPFTSNYSVNESRLRFLSEEVEQLAQDGNELVGNSMKSYQGHFNLDYSIQVLDNQIIVTYMGFGKLPDGTIETIDEIKTYPYFLFEDQSAGQWIPPGYPWEEEFEPLYQSPIIDPPYSESK